LTERDGRVRLRPIGLEVGHYAAVHKAAYEGLIPTVRHGGGHWVTVEDAQRILAAAALATTVGIALYTSIRFVMELQAPVTVVDGRPVLMLPVPIGRAT
jgi:hypothetical protein